nr:hypothetical protein [Tanacetum cinerariifolium]
MEQLTSIDDQSLSDEDVPEKIFSNPLFEEEIIPIKIEQHHDNAESNLVESLRTHDSSLIISSKIDSLLDEFVDDLMPPGIEEDDDDSERDILILEELVDIYSLSLLENESFHFDIPSSSRPPAKPLDVIYRQSSNLQSHNDYLDSQKKLTITLTKVTEQMTSLTSMYELACQIVQKKLEEKQVEEEQVAKAQNWKPPVCYDDDDDEESSNSLEDNIIFELPPCDAVTPSEPIDSLSMGDEHLDTIPATKSDKFIKSSVKNLLPNPSESEGKNECDVPAGFTTFSNVDFLFDEFAGELTLLKSILPGIDETDCHPEKETRFTKRFLDIPILEELLDNCSLSLPDNESHHFDIPSPYRSPAKPPNGKTGTLNIKMMGDVSGQKVPIPGLTITRISNQEKSPDLLSHHGLEAFQHSAECPMIINGKNTPLLDVSFFHFYPP